MAPSLGQISAIPGSRSGVFLLRKGCQTQIKTYASAVSRPVAQGDERLMRRNAGAHAVVAASLCRGTKRMSARTATQRRGLYSSLIPLNLFEPRIARSDLRRGRRKTVPWLKQ